MRSVCSVPNKAEISWKFKENCLYTLGLHKYLREKKKIKFWIVAVSGFFFSEMIQHIDICQIPESDINLLVALKVLQV